MPEAEIFIAALITMLSDVEFMSFALRQGKDIHNHLNKWHETLATIQAVLTDAKEKQSTDTDVKKWLEDLGDLAYDMDDLLDELSTEYSRQRNLMDDDDDQAINTCSSKIIMNYFIPTCCTSFNLMPTVFMFDHRKMISDMKEITIRLEQIVRSGNFFLREISSGVWSNRLIFTKRTRSFLDDSVVFGRENDKRVMVEMILKHHEEANNPQVFSVIPIVGPPGVGKTTLAQLVYNDEEVTRHFDLKIWVCVSEEFDALRITKTILESVTRENIKIMDFNMLQLSLKEKLSKRRFLLVLDDVWNEDYEKWDKLCAPLRAGALGSKILLTTRNDHVASTVSSVLPFHLDVLKNDDCLSILAYYALGSSNFDAYPHLKLFGEEIAKSCGGNPLAAKALGNLLFLKEDAREWKFIMESKMWDIQDMLGILPALRLSYEHLPSHLKLLFVYCSIFPYDYVFDRDELVLLWMAEGFLQQSENGKPMEDLGCECFDELLSRSFFQRSIGSESRFVMPNLMNDLAQGVAGKLSFKLDSKTRSFKEHKKARHSSFIRRKYEALKNFKDFHEIKALRTFLPLPIFASDWQEFYLSNRVLTDLLPRLQCLRVLSFSGYSISEIPESIGDLKQLRYLNFSDTLIRWLPESVSNLYNLQTLLLRRCRRLTKLPTGIGNLINLRHLDCTETNQLREMPPGIGNLKNLRTLSKIVLGKDNGLGELKSLSDIQGRLAILGLHTVTNIQDAKEVLSSKNGIDEVIMEWRNSIYDSQNRICEKDVLDVLQPPRNLKNLKLVLYGGTKFPEWVGGTPCSNMVDLELRNCRQCTSLPSLGQLPSLKKLHIHGIDRLKSVGVEFYGDVSPLMVIFPKLETLRFEEMPDWEEWSTLNGVDVFPCLRELIIIDCPHLTNVSLSRLPSLQVLKLNGCPEVVLKCMVSFASLTTLTIQGISGLRRLQKETIPFLGKLENLEIKQCREMKSLWKEECPCKQPGALLQSLKILSLDDCRNLKKLPNGLNNLTSLQGLRIENCPKIVCLPDAGLPLSLTSLKIGNCKALEVPAHNNDSVKFSHLEKLWIEDCSSLVYFPIGNLPSTLKELRILHCMKLEKDVEKPLPNGMLSLEHLTINGLMNFKTFPACFDNFVNLTELIIQRCLGLESFPEEGFPSKLRRLSIHNCGNLNSLPVQMQNLTSLVYLDIYGCPSLKSFLLPTCVKELCLGDLGVPISELDLQLLKSLDFFGIIGECRKLVSFPDKLSKSIRRLKINGAVDLESLSTVPRDLPDLEEVSVWDCPKLRYLPKKMLTSLLFLDIWRCPLLEKRCLKEKGEYWALIAEIPCVMMDCENIQKL